MLFFMLRPFCQENSVVDVFFVEMKMRVSPILFIFAQL